VTRHGPENRILSQSSPRKPAIIALYEQFLVHQDIALFADGVTDLYDVSTIERLCELGSRTARRGAALALGLIGDYSSNPVLGRSLLDEDRGVRTLADSGIRNLWRRVGNSAERERLERVAEMNSAKEFAGAVRLASQLIRQAPWFAEAWNQRALAHFNLAQYEDSIRDCRQTLEINPFHFPAATGMGKCHLQLNDRVAALEAFRRALRLNPGLDDVRAHVVFLQRALKDK
jgi:tetratricopeptide (TPR) repeat protein